MCSEALRHTLEQLDGDRVRQRLFIAGCARSGTTLLLNMMRCFEDTHVERNERPASFFAHMRSQRPVQVCKRTHRCWRTLYKIPHSVRIIYVVRHPYDVLTSHHPNYSRRFYTSLERWRNEFEGFERLVGRGRHEADLLVVRYEDLVRCPGDIQHRMEVLWGLKSRLSFDRFPEAVAVAGGELEGTSLALRGLRRPDTRSIDKWRRSSEFATYIQQLINRCPQDLARFLDHFGYDRGDFDFPAKPTETVTLETSDEGGGFWELRDEIGGVVPEGEAFILVGFDWLELDLLPGRRPVYFREREGLYWGLPSDDTDAIREIERSRRAGASFAVFPWSAFWCLEHYPGLSAHLRAEYSCVVDNERIVAFDLRR